MLLTIKDLSVEFSSMQQTVKALNHVSFSIDQGEIVGIVGESGSGKSVTALTILGLLDNNATIKNGEILYKGRNVLQLHKKEQQSLRGKQIGMIFQEPMTALHPTMRIGDQLAKVIHRHREIAYKEAYRQAVLSLAEVKINEPELVARKYPFELSGGMRQRVVIALAMSAPPDLLIADEPTTALDVTIQHEILKLMKELAEKRGTSIMLITHDLGVVAEVCQRVVVMYAGEVVETGTTDEVLAHPVHPYTRALIGALPDLASPDQPLHAIPGESPDLRNLPSGCVFAPRCDRALPLCREDHPVLEPVPGSRDASTGTHQVACWVR
ncbi:MULTISPECIES: ABC transporter ATP-binding protein [Brevibacillus]|jgi:oligopeptide/dipeptide ABC transporter ATP-binding protein|uniref:ABC transporter ATP-binding protein n=1 Tax=Brevibacillus TaxID=55080 RepID=UPI0004F36CCF|nr:ABC transporter ATP-binding protein [Brevibacillus borstelensis]KKX55387.1 peptide ABC transporter substrate-binding protein [Brevibacillus borstelensis cifa_chp40]MBE5397651.1 ABC transporter ATP-binding protein [Brevibacillus borstelensis]MCC0563651.1 ABC transporter ATP-binding protein [Brevibacillus borstelensis]MCM3469295.1 ABC transporter ATP-binding protein [Brevibacillus borstelensis]MCM3558757.1 ABC transporter ATP-binding protein [Brevibacillus borstelensis]